MLSDEGEEGINAVVQSHDPEGFLLVV